MSVNSFPQNFPPSLAKVADPDGTFTDPWSVFLLSLWQRTGQASGIIPSVGVGLVASGNTQAGALTLTLDWNDVGTVAAGSGVLIPPLNAGQDIVIFNSGANVLSVYPPSGKAIDALAVNAAYSLAVGKMQIFRVLSLTQIRSTQFG